MRENQFLRNQNCCQTSKFWSKKKIFFHQSTKVSSFLRNHNFEKQLKILVKKSKIWPTTKILLENQNFGRKPPSKLVKN